MTRGVLSAILALGLVFCSAAPAQPSTAGVSPPQAWGDPDWEKWQAKKAGGGLEGVDPTRPWWALGVDARSPVATREPEINRELRLVEDEDAGDHTGSPLQDAAYLGRVRVTGYDLCAACCGKTDGITASGAAAVVGVTCACNGLPFGSVVYIDGLGYRTVQDRGGMQGFDVDVLCEDHAGCYEITGYRDVWVVSQ